MRQLVYLPEFHTFCLFILIKYFILQFQRFLQETGCLGKRIRILLLSQSFLNHRNLRKI